MINGRYFPNVSPLAHFILYMEVVVPTFCNYEHLLYSLPGVWTLLCKHLAEYQLSQTNIQFMTNLTPTFYLCVCQPAVPPAAAAADGSESV